MKLDKKTKRLIAVGASIGANCQPCLQINAAKAIEEGIAEQEIAEAIEIGRMVRQGATAKMEKFVLSLSRAAPVPNSGTEVGCGCNTTK